MLQISTDFSKDTDFVSSVGMLISTVWPRSLPGLVFDFDPCSVQYKLIILTFIGG